MAAEHDITSPPTGISKISNVELDAGLIIYIGAGNLIKTSNNAEPNPSPGADTEWDDVSASALADDIFNITGFTLGSSSTALTSTADLGAAAIATDAQDGKFHISENFGIHASADGDAVSGFAFQNDVAFTGTFGFANTGVLTVRNAGTGDAIGSAFLKTDGAAQDFNGKATLGGINVTAVNGDAIGWYSGAVGTAGDLELGTLSVNAGGGATGVYIHGNFGGKLSFDSIRAIGAGNGVNATTAGITIVDGRFTQGTSNIGAIYAEATGTVANENVYGIVASGTGSSGSNFTATNDITAKNMGVGDARAISMQGGNSIVTVDSGTIEAINTGIGNAMGVEMLGDSNRIKIENNASVRAEAAQGDAYGVHIDGNLIDDPTNRNNRSAVKNITARSEEGNAFGLYVTGVVEDIYLKGDIEVTGAGVQTSGIRTRNNTTITLFNGSVAISTDYTGQTAPWEGADIWSDGELDIQLNGANLTADTVRVDNDNNLRIGGRGRADLGVVKLGESAWFNLGNEELYRTIVAVDGGRMIEENGYLGTVNIDNAGILEIYGDTDDFNREIGFLDTGDPLQVVGTSMFTRWGVASDFAIRALGVYDRVQANDNYLAAAMIHHKRTGWNAVRDHMISGAVRSQPRYGYYGQAPCGCVYACTPAAGCKKAKTRGAWMNYVGRSSHYESSFNGNRWNFLTDGIQLGTDFFQTRNMQFGMLFGYENSTGSNSVGVDLRDRIAADDYYVGLYGAYVFGGGTDLRTVFNFGWQDYTTNRNAANGQLYRTGFKGNTAEVNVELGRRYYFPDRYGVVSLRPAVGLDWYWNQLGGGGEVPMGPPMDTSQAIRYGKADISQLFLRFGTDMRYERGRGAVEAGIYYSYDLRGSDLWASASSVALPDLRSALVSSKQGRSVFSFNIGGSYLMGNSVTVFGGYRGEAMPDKAGRGYEHIGYVGGAWRW